MVGWVDLISQQKLRRWSVVDDLNVTLNCGKTYKRNGIENWTIKIKPLTRCRFDRSLCVLKTKLQRHPIKSSKLKITAERWDGFNVELELRQWAIADGLGFIPEDDPETYYHNFDPPRRGRFCHFGTSRGANLMETWWTLLSQR